MCYSIKGWFALLLAIAMPLLVRAQIITTVAGNGTSGYIGDGGVATAARIDNPFSVTTDNAGNFYLGVWQPWSGFARIRKVDAYGTITTCVGDGTTGFSGDGGPATAAHIYYGSTACDGSGNLYIMDWGNARIRKVSAATGIITTIAGNGISGNTGDGGQATAAEIYGNPTLYGDDIPIASDPAGNVYFFTSSWHTIRRVDASTGIITTVGGNGSYGFSGDGGPATAASFGFVHGLAADGAGNVFVSDGSNNRVRKINSSGRVSTIAGNGGTGFSGDGGPATAAQIYYPLGIAVDGAGNIILGSTNSSRVRLVNATGIITTIAGTGTFGYTGDGGPATSARLSQAFGVAFDSLGNIFIGDCGNVRVRKIVNSNHAPRFISGRVQTFAICENTAGDSINSLLGVIDSDLMQTEIWMAVTSPHHGTLSVIDTAISTGALVLAHGSCYTPATGFNGRDTFRISVYDGFAMDTTTIYVTVNPQPTITSPGSSIALGYYTTLTSAGCAWSSGSTGIATVGSLSGVVTGLSSGNATITATLTTGCSNTTTVDVFPYSGLIMNTVAGDGAMGYSGDGGQATAAKINQVFHSAVDAAGNIYISDYANNRIRKVNTSGVITTIAGTGTAGYSGDGGTATAANMYNPMGIAVDASGNIVFADNYNHCIRRISTSGIITTIAGTGTVSGYSGDGGAATAATFYYPSGITFDASGNLIIADEWNNRLRKVSTSGIISTIAGNGSTGWMAGGYGGDGGAATAAQINVPTAVAVDPSGNIFIADQGNQRLRKINTSGTITTFAGNGSAGYSSDGIAATSGMIDNPAGVVADAFGNVYFSDEYTHRVREVNTAGTMTTIAGSGGPGWSGDGCVATSDLLNNPTGLSIDGMGSIYVADHANNRLRKIYANHPPVFTGGHRIMLSLCQSMPDSIGSVLSISDPDPQQAEWWDHFTSPVHGTVISTFRDSTNGGVVTPVVVYTPTAGYTGTDSFMIQVYDCGGGRDTTKVILTINPPPAPIAGASTVCTGLSTTLTDAVPGGVWTTSSISTATVDSTSGAVTGLAAGTVTVTYSPGAGCSATKTMTVTASPAVSGAPIVCMGIPDTFTGSPSGGMWSTTSFTLSIGSSSGIASGTAAGSGLITYTQGSCYTTKPVTVNGATPVITGIYATCVGAPQALFDLATGGVWSSAGTGIASVDSFTGIVTGVSAGSTTMSYTLPGGCYATIPFYVSAAPAAPMGAGTVCVGLPTTYTDTTSGGGEWSASGLFTSATVDSFTGVVTGVSPGIQTIEFTSFVTGCSSSATVTVNSVPAGISGVDSVCVGTTATLSVTGSPGGAWSSSNPARATVGSATGIVTGVTAGTVTITYSAGAGCYATKVITVNSTAGSIGGTLGLCQGTSATLTVTGMAGGTWSSSAPLVAAIGSSSGTVTTPGTGTAIITYSVGAGCRATATVTVDATPLPIGGTLNVCQGSTSTLSDATAGGVWTSASTGVATIGSGTGTVSGSAAGTALISYTTGGLCAATATVTVNPLPPTIIGTTHVCAGSTTLLTDGAGLWTSGSTTVATVGSTTGVVSGASAGITAITFTSPAGCSTTTPLTVNPLPAAITGGSSLCVGATMTEASTTTGGTWSRSNTNINVGGSTGLVTGITAGTSVVTYTLPTGCYVIKTVTVNTTASPISGTLAVCPSSTSTLGDATPGGVWTSSAPGTATIGSATGTLTGMASGTATISYTIGSGCYAMAVATVNSLPTAYNVTGGGNYCAGGTGLHVGLTGSTPGVNYQLYNGSTATGAVLTGTGAALDFGLQTVAGIYTVQATNATACSRTMTGSATITINPLPPAISGGTAVCVGSTIALTDTGSSGGTWSSGTPGVATVGSATGMVTGSTIGTTIITYTLPTTCYTTTMVTVSTSPTAISGSPTVCAGSSTVLTDVVPGGTWTSGAPGTATVGSVSGVVSGIAAGTTGITYSLGTGCFVTRAVTVNTAPAAITGSIAVCTGRTTALSSTTTGGTWSSSMTSVATAGSAGVVTGISAGTATISYVLPATGCMAATMVTVNAIPPAITGTLRVCQGATTALSDLAGGGTWTSGTPAIATIGSGGIVTGVTTGVSVVSYSIGTGCATSALVTVNAVPAAITGPSAICAGATATVADATPGGTWTSSVPAVATISTPGVVTALAAGITTITYTGPNGCAAIKLITVNAVPAAITGAGLVCAGGSAALASATGGGTWTSSNILVATVGTSGTLSGVGAGTATITYALGTGCFVTKTVTVTALPLPITGTASVCAGATTTLTDATLGGTWMSGAAGTAVIGSASGVVTGVTAGTVTISYTAPGGCSVARIVTVNELPAPITGSPAACVGAATALGETTTGGAWSSSNTAIATVTPAGIVTGVNAGTAIITYTSAAGCAATLWMTVNPSPLPIAGTVNICVAGGTTLSDMTPGGTWSSSNTTVATIGATTGVVSGMAGGSTTISYTAVTGCAATRVLSVIAVPAITGLRSICAWGDTLHIGDGMTTGIYSSSGVTVTSLGGGAAVLQSAAAGVGTVYYTVPPGCYTTATVTVNPLPNAITGAYAICMGATAMLHDASTGGTWSSGSPAIAAVGSATGVVSGIGAGTAYITYTLPTGCKTDTAVHVNPGPSFVSGYPTMAVGTSATYYDLTTGGTWSSSNSTVAAIGSTTGLAHALSAGIVTFTYTLTSGCGATKIVTVNTAGPTKPLILTGQERNRFDLNVRPNPNDGDFIVAATLGEATEPNGEAWIEITDLAGRTVYASKLHAHEGVINEEIRLQQPAGGVYLLSLRYGGDRSLVRMVVLER